MTAENLVTVVFEELVDYINGHGDKAVLVLPEKVDLA